MKRTFVFISVLLLAVVIISSPAYANAAEIDNLQQSPDSVTAGEEWVQVYRTGSYEEINSVRETDDGGFVTVGYSSGNIWVMKLDATGAVVWQNTYGSSQTQYGEDIITTSDGGFIVAGYNSTFGQGDSDALVIKLNSDGTVAWQNMYGSSTLDDEALSIIETSDGGFFVVGNTGTISNDVWVAKLNADGSVAWERDFTTISHETANAAVELSDGSLVVVGTTDIGGTSANFQGLVIKLDANGGLIWQNTYGGSSSEFAHSVSATNDGGFVVSGETLSFGAGSYDVWVIRLNGDGTTVWQNSYGGSNSEYGRSIAATSDGGFVFTGESSSFAVGFSDAWAVKLNGDGSVAWENAYGSSRIDESHAIAPTSDGGFVVSGYSRALGSHEGDGVVLKLDETGSIANCNAARSTQSVVTSSSDAPIPWTGTMQVVSGTVVTSSLLMAPFSATTTTVCAQFAAACDITNK